MALALIDEFAEVVESRSYLQAELRAHVSGWPRVFGSKKISFGRRLLLGLEKLESSTKGAISHAVLWDALVRNSSVMKNIIAKSEGVIRHETEGFSPLADEDAVDQAPKALDKDLDETLRKYTRDFNQLAEDGEFDPVVGRELELRRVFEIFGRKKKSNPQSTVFLQIGRLIF